MHIAKIINVISSIRKSVTNDLSLSQYHIMLLLYFNEARDCDIKDISMGALCKLLDTSRPATVKACSLLASSGFINIDKSQMLYNELVVSLSNKGKIIVMESLNIS